MEMTKQEILFVVLFSVGITALAAIETRWRKKEWLPLPNIVALFVMLLLAALIVVYSRQATGHHWPN